MKPKPSGDGFYHSVRIPAIFAIPGSSVVVAVVVTTPLPAEYGGPVQVVGPR